MIKNLKMADNAVIRRERRSTRPKLNCTCFVLFILVFCIFLNGTQLYFHYQFETKTHMKLMDQIRTDLSYLESHITSGRYKVEQHFMDMAYRMIYVILHPNNQWDIANGYPFINESNLVGSNATLKNEENPLKKSDGKARQSPTQAICPIRMPITFSTIPHVLNNQQSLVPRYLVQSDRYDIEYVIGIGIEKQNWTAYLHSSITDVVRGLPPKMYNTTLIVFYIGDPELEYVLETTKIIEDVVPNQIEDGLIEIIAPSPSYYPDFDAISDLASLENPSEIKLRTKQNLDVAYLMSYSESRGKYFLLLKDDVLAKKNYLDVIDNFVQENNDVDTNWLMLDFGFSGVLGKLFKSRQIPNFVAYLLIMYQDMPIDMIVEAYVTNKVCHKEWEKDKCNLNKRRNRPQLSSNTKLFKDIDFFYSTERKKTNCLENSFDEDKFYSKHVNPPASRFNSTMCHVNKDSLKAVYDGKNYFLGITGRANESLEIYFEQPTWIGNFSIRTGVVTMANKVLTDAVVDVLPNNKTQFQKVAEFDNFGVADGSLEAFYYIDCIRIRLTADTKICTVISEIRFESKTGVAAKKEKKYQGFKHPLFRNC